jgi:transglycosylase-like protein
VRAVLVTGLAALVLAWPAAAARGQYSATWLAQARCIHLHEGPWNANTGNGYFGGMQFSAQTWKRVGGETDAAFAHPGDPAYPFRATAAEQLYRAWRLWKHDGSSWRSWGAVGAACS